MTIVRDGRGSFKRKILNRLTSKSGSKENLVLRGPMGVGKTTVCKEAIEGYAPNGGRRILGICWEWCWSESARVEGPAVEARRCVSILRAEDGQCTPWSHALDESWERLPPIGDALKASRLESFPRDLDKTIDECIHADYEIVMIVDKLDSVAKVKFIDSDFEALGRFRELGVRVLFEVREPQFVERWERWRRNPGAFPYSVLEYVALGDLEAEVVAAEAWRRNSGELVRVPNDQRSRLHVALIREAGHHAGTLCELCKGVGQWSSEGGKKVEGLAPALEIVRRGRAEGSVQEYLELRWRALGEDERLALAVAFLAQAGFGGFEILISAWNVLSGEPSTRGGSWTDVGRSLGKEWGLLRRREGDVQIDGILMGDFIGRQEECRIARERLGVTKVPDISFRWDRFLLYWIVTMALYFALSLGAFLGVERALEAPLGWWLACWIPVSFYCAYALGGVALRKVGAKWLIGRRKMTR